MKRLLPIFLLISSICNGYYVDNIEIPDQYTYTIIEIIIQYEYSVYLPPRSEPHGETFHDSRPYSSSWDNSDSGQRISDGDAMAMSMLSSIQRENDFKPQYDENHETYKRLSATVKRNGETIHDAKKSLNDLKSVKQTLENQIKRKKSLKDQIKGSEFEESKNRLLDVATDSMKLTRDFAKAEDFESVGIASSITNGLLDLATSFTPGISWARDLYESLTGKDLISDESLSSFDRTMAVVGATTFGFGNKAVKALGVFEKLEKTGKRFGAAGKLLYEKSISELKNTVGFFKKHKIYGGREDRWATDVANAFMKGAQVKKVDSDMKVYRYYSDTYPQSKRGYWVSKENIDVDFAKERFALKYPVNSKAEWTIPKGTEILEGTVAPNFGHQGGAHQILVDLEKLQ